MVSQMWSLANHYSRARILGYHCGSVADRNLAESYWSARPGRDYADTVARLWPEFGETYFELGKVKAVFAGPGMPLTQVNGFGLFGEQTQEDLDAIRRFYE